MRYTAGDDGCILCDSRGDGNRTITVSEEEWPIQPWKIASLMNAAFEQGRRSKLEDIQLALGVKS